MGRETKGTFAAKFANEARISLRRCRLSWPELMTSGVTGGASTLARGLYTETRRCSGVELLLGSSISRPISGTLWRPPLAPVRYEVYAGVVTTPRHEVVQTCTARELLLLRLFGAEI